MRSLRLCITSRDCYSSINQQIVYFENMEICQEKAESITAKGPRTSQNNHNTNNIILKLLDSSMLLIPIFRYVCLPSVRLHKTICPCPVVICISFYLWNKRVCEKRNANSLTRSSCLNRFGTIYNHLFKHKSNLTDLNHIYTCCMPLFVL